MTERDIATCPRCGGHLTTDTHGAVALPRRFRYTLLNGNLVENDPRPTTIEACDRCEFAREKGDDR